MKLLTKKIKEQATKQYKQGTDMEQMVVAKYFDPMGSWKWFLMNMHKDDDYCWGIVKGHEVEMGSFSMKELESIKLPFGLKIERDLMFEPMKASEVWKQLNDGKHV
jgi:hypothetical protein